MADTVITFDANTKQAEAKLKSLKRQADQTGKTFGAAQAGAIAGRMGGPGGALAARFIGGGPIGAGMAVAGMGLSSILAADARRVDAAKAREEGRLRMDQARADGAKGRQSLNAGALSSQSVVRRLTTRGMAGLEYQPDELARRRGISAFTAAEALVVGQDTGVSADQIAWLMSTGEFDSPAEAASAIKSGNGIVGALSLKRGISPDEANAQLDATMTPEAQAVGRAASSDVGLFNQQLGALRGGAAATALQSQVSQTLNPEQASLDAARQEIERNITVLLAAAEAQGKLAATFQILGRAIGLGAGSAGQQASAAIAATPE
jgi:hypothetical protein